MTTTEARTALTSGRPEQVPVRVLDAARCHLGEGPAYDAASNTAWWFDILGRRLHEAALSTDTVIVHALPVMASALAVVDDARHVLVAENGLHLRDMRSGAMTHLAPIEQEDARTRSNDARVHPSGTLWSSMMGRRAERGLATIYACRGGAARPLFTGLTIPNAICFSPDGTAGYFADTAENRLYRVDLDPETGLPRDEPRLLLRHEGPGGLDGAVTDAEGLIWCAIWGGGCLHVYSPAGRLVRRVSVPARQPSCPVFVGPRFDRLLVTSAWQDMGEAARAADPGHGQTFILDVGTQGRAEPRMSAGGLP